MKINRIVPRTFNESGLRPNDSLLSKIEEALRKISDSVEDVKKKKGGTDALEKEESGREIDCFKPFNEPTHNIPEK